ncbi:TraR/DksA C4-type zinc finger protein [Acidimicrobiia bacterium EGI L10123]|uniref:TraR/DksA family transcriptional regulator n=1 Tax=Salinilacustrithrix flava TaxID=2957203 RepID=UPI003D7C2C6E|nr:TraR/DksA C4-type zinc finger protein [Acidimicrobiia bacterium EGI L10123]
MARASKASAASKKKATTKKAAANKARSGGAAKATSKTTKKAATKAAAKKSAKATTKATTKASSKSTTKAASTKSTAKKAPAKSGRAKKSSHFDSKFLEKMRKLLHAERDTYERQAKQLRAEADSLVMDMDPGDVQFDEESGEGDTIAVERGRDLALAAQAMDMIEEIDHALTKFDEGTYGICEVSGEPIPQERLEAIPWAREKVEYKVGGFGRR